MNSQTKPDKRFENIVIISLDCVRPEALGCYPQRFPLPARLSRGTQTPNIDLLAIGGHRFDQAITQAPFTPAAHASLFAGLIPPKHGIRTMLGSRLREDVITLAEILSAAGWRCGAVVGSHALGHEYGLDRGFDHYDDDIKTGIRSWNLGERRDAIAVTDRAIAWLESVQERHFFLFVHYFDAHDIGQQPSGKQHTGSPSGGLRRALPASVQSAMRAPWQVVRSGLRYFEIGHRYRTYGRRFMLRQVTKIDEQLGRLLDILSERSQLDKTLTILIADHGDDFWEHSEPTHRKYLYDTTLRIPLIIYPRIGARTVIEDQVRVVDIPPSVLDLLGVDSGRVEMDGTSLVDLLETPACEDAAPLPRTAYAETVMESMNTGGTGIVTCLAALRAPPWKLIWDRLENSFELYNVEEDPGESKNLYNSNQQLATTLSARLLPLAQEMPVWMEDADAVIVERLQALGYL